MSVITSEVISPNGYEGRLRPMRLIILHTIENDETPTGAEGCANFFANPASRVSAHLTTDSDSAVRCRYKQDTAWATPSANADGYQVEQTGRAHQGVDGWADPFSLAMIDITAQAIVEECGDELRLGTIPMRHLTPDEISAGMPGFCGHIDCTRAFPGSGDHTDPSDEYPWDYFFEKLKLHLGMTPSSPTPALPEEEPVLTVLHDPADLNHHKFTQTGFQMGFDPNGPAADQPKRSANGYKHCYVDAAVDKATTVHLVLHERDGGEKLRVEQSLPVNGSKTWDLGDGVIHPVAGTLVFPTPGALNEVYADGDALITLSVVGTTVDP